MCAVERWWQGTQSGSVLGMTDDLAVSPQPGSFISAATVHSPASDSTPPAHAPPVIHNWTRQSEDQGGPFSHFWDSSGILLNILILYRTERHVENMFFCNIFFESKIKGGRWGCILNQFHNPSPTTRCKIYLSYYFPPYIWTLPAVHVGTNELKFSGFLGRTPSEGKQIKHFLVSKRLGSKC